MSRALPILRAKYVLAGLAWWLGAVFFSPGLRAAEVAVDGTDPTVVGREGREILYPRLDYGPSPMETDSSLEVRRFIVPAPRSLIVTREGLPLAQNRVASRVLVRLPAVASTPAEAVVWVRSLPTRLGPGIPLMRLEDGEIRRHFKNRPHLPIAITEVLSGDEERQVRLDLPEGCFFDKVYVRHYPEGALTAHLVGYTGVSLPDQHGPVAAEEYLGPLAEGRAGMEKTLDETLRGEAGEVIRVFDKDGRLLHQEVARDAVPGPTLILSLNLKMQRLAMEALQASGRPGAFVAVDALSGDVLALASYPSFDPNLFGKGITAGQYSALSGAGDAPLFDRAVSGAYPPGSTFKPFVALAGMSSGKISGAATKFAGPGEMLIAGRIFRNWNPLDEGIMDVKYAMLRSCNTWFYQAALETGAAPISAMSHRFGFGEAPDLPLPSVSAGHIPVAETYNDPRSLANYAIGQGRVLISPMQMALAMAGLANGTRVPRPRLIQGLIDARTEAVIERHEGQAARLLQVRMADIELVRDGMWGVVNFPGGTARSARMKTPDVYGKTGTSQWSNDGKRASLAWFVGWVDAIDPCIAFTVVTHGRDGEPLSGGGDAAPIAAGLLRAVYAEPELHGVTLPQVPSRDDPVITLPEPLSPSVPSPDPATLPVRDLPVEFDLPPERRRFFDLLFGRGRP